MLSGDVPMMWGVLDDDIYNTRYISVGGYKMINDRGKGFPAPSFWFLVVNYKGVDLIGLV